MDTLKNSQQAENTTSPEKTLCSCNGDYLVEFSGSEFAYQNETGRKIVADIEIGALSVDSIQCQECEKFFEPGFLVDLQ